MPPGRTLHALAFSLASSGGRIGVPHIGMYPPFAPFLSPDVDVLPFLCRPALIVGHDVTTFVDQQLFVPVERCSLLAKLRDSEGHVQGGHGLDRWPTDHRVGVWRQYSGQSTPGSEPASIY